MKRSMNAAKIMIAWADGCIQSSGLSNTWIADGKSYTWMPLKTFEDNATVGTIYRNDIGRIVSSFRIDGDGEVVRAPKFLRRVSKAIETELLRESSRLKVH